MTTFADLVGVVIGIINGLVWVLGSLALLLFMWGVVQYILKPADKHKRSYVLWSFIALFVLFSVWGIVRLMCATFLPGGTCGSSSATNIVPSSYSTPNQGNPANPYTNYNL